MWDSGDWRTMMQHDAWPTCMFSTPPDHVMEEAMKEDWGTYIGVYDLWKLTTSF